MHKFILLVVAMCLTMLATAGCSKVDEAPQPTQMRFQTVIPEPHKEIIELHLWNLAAKQPILYPMSADTQRYLRAELAALAKCQAAKNCK